MSKVRTFGQTSRIIRFLWAPGPGGRTVSKRNPVLISRAARRTSAVTVVPSA